MKKTRGLLLAVAAAAMAFTFSCSSDDGDGGGSSCTNFKSVKIGTQTWMAENLNCNVEGSICNDDDPANCKKYGRLYNWETALTVCPSGWHLPSDAEWYVLVNYAGGTSYAGASLKAKSGWNYQGVDGNGTDEYGFSALPGGTCYENGFCGIGSGGFWWTARTDGDGAFGIYMEHSSDKAASVYGSEYTFHSVRCVRNN